MQYQNLYCNQCCTLQRYRLSVAIFCVRWHGWSELFPAVHGNSLFQKLFTLFQAFIIHSKALNHIFLQNSGCPYTELGCLNGVYSVTYGNNDIQIVIIGRNTAVGMIDIPTEQKILAMMEEMQTNPQDFRFVA